MVSTRNTISRRSIVAREDSPSVEAVGSEPEGAISDIPGLVSVSFLVDQLFLHINCLGPPLLPAA